MSNQHRDPATSLHGDTHKRWIEQGVDVIPDSHDSSGVANTVYSVVQTELRKQQNKYMLMESLQFG